MTLVTIFFYFYRAFLFFILYLNSTYGVVQEKNSTYRGICVHK